MAFVFVMVCLPVLPMSFGIQPADISAAGDIPSVLSAIILP
jgi:hypothetical protein